MRFSAPKPCDRANCVCFACKVPIAIGEPLSFESKKPHCMKCAAELPNKAVITAPVFDVSALVEAIKSLKDQPDIRLMDAQSSGHDVSMPADFAASVTGRLKDLETLFHQIDKRQAQIEKRFDWLRDTICKELNLGECPF